MHGNQTNTKDGRSDAGKAMHARRRENRGGDVRS